MRTAARSLRDRRAGRALARRRRGRLRHRRRRGRATRRPATSTRSSTCSRENFHTTIHAGEAFGLPSIWEAVQFCGAERLGHGVRIVDDITGPPGEEQLGRLAAYVRDRRIPLELCPTSQRRHRRVRDDRRASRSACCAGCGSGSRVNTDNRLMSDTSMTNEMEQLRDAFGWGIDDFEWLTINAMKSAFAPFPERLRIINGIDQAALRAGSRRRRPSAVELKP